MDYNASIKEAVDFIEEHLFESVTPAQVAAKVGFSGYHFHRIFHGMLGESTAGYIRMRRISEAAGFQKDENFSKRC